jgi:hypothetical protein
MQTRHIILCFLRTQQQTHLIPSHRRVWEPLSPFHHKTSVTLYTHSTSGISRRSSFSAWLQFPLKYFTQYRSIFTSSLSRFVVLLLSNSIQSEEVFWDVASCGLVELYRRFTGAYCLHQLKNVIFTLAAVRTWNFTYIHSIGCFTLHVSFFFILCCWSNLCLLMVYVPILSVAHTI